MSLSFVEAHKLLQLQARRQPHLAYVLDAYDPTHHRRLATFGHPRLAATHTRRRTTTASTRRAHVKGVGGKRSEDMKGAPWRVGTDCSGIEAPLYALDHLRIPYTHVFSCDVDPHVRTSIQANHHPQHVYTDVLARDHTQLPDIDVYVCGFPCQSFSDINRNGAQGFYQENRKGILFFHCYEVICHKRPRVFVLENVKSLLTHDGGRTFAVIQRYLHTLTPEYAIAHQVLNAKDYDGHLQSRPRVYIVGIRRDCQQAPFAFPKPTTRRTPLRRVLLDAPEVPPLVLTPHKKALLQRLVDEGHDLEEDYIVNLNISGGPKFPPNAMKDKSPCLLAYCSPFYLTARKRGMLPREALRIQGFPDTLQQVVSDRQMLQQCGNSMSVGVLTHLFRAILASVVKA